MAIVATANPNHLLTVTVTTAGTLLLLAASFAVGAGPGEVIWAVNCGGDDHVDVYGVHYQRDSLRAGFASDHGKNIGIRRVAPPDQILYQTERYHTSTFSYDVPVRSDGEYVLVLKFSEVWFTEPSQKVNRPCPRLY